MAYLNEIKSVGSYKAISEHPALGLYERLLQFTYEQPYGDEPYSLQNLLGTIDAVSRMLPELVGNGGAFDALASDIATLLHAHKGEYQAKINMVTEVANAQKQLLQEARDATIAAANARYEQSAAPIDKALGQYQELEQYLKEIK